MNTFTPPLLRRRQMMMSKSLPYDAEIEYLESTGTSGFYINTGISKPSSFQNATIITEVQFLSTSERQIHGAVNSFYVGVNNKRWECAYTIYRGTADMNRHTLKKYLGLNSNRKQMIISCIF